MSVVLDVALSSAPWERILAFAYVLARNKVNASDLEVNLQCSRGTALRTMKTLQLLKLVELQVTTMFSNSGVQKAYEMQLRWEFEWFKSQEFKDFWRQKPKEFSNVEPKRPESEPTEERPITQEELAAFEQDLEVGSFKAKGA